MTDNLFNHPRYPLLVVISGPSGVGKDAALERMKERRLPFYFVVTATTRPPRPGEVHGRDYLFLSKDEFAEMIEDDELLEYAVVYDDFKGVPKQQVRDALGSGLDAVMRVDVQGAASIRASLPGTVTIFISTASEDELKERLTARNTETAESLKLRIATARRELQRLHEFDYCVVNHQGALDETVDKIVAIIEAEHCRTAQRPMSL
jgi:guanylate kinase